MSTLAESIASRVLARANCIAERGPNVSHYAEWVGEHGGAADALARDYLPSGSGFDLGTFIEWESSTAEKLVFSTSYHHMNEAGYYDGWTDHKVTVRASLVFGLDIRVSGRDRNGIKDYIADCFATALRASVPA